MIEYFRENFKLFEDTYKDLTGTIYILVAVFLAASLISFSRVLINEIYNLELLFVSFLVAFLVNYYLVRSGGV